MNAVPTPASFLQLAWTTSGNETLTVTTPAAGTLYIMVRG